ncbi:AAA family ATPase [Proteus sp. G2669]|uniref:AAA family ATPase n=1 Tax=Proteus sp. G2669 TaxID=2698881 RepID=UPI001FB7EC1C|nr:AAA family ATPase [Proteus sp. G2669]
MKNIIYKERLINWIYINNEFFTPELINTWIKPISDLSNNNIGYEINRIELEKSIKKLSSGQAVFLYIMTEIIANIRYDSLIIFDEPETHLHPNAISQLINSIHSLADKFKSYCIIATHSPIIVQGILSKNIFVMKNENQVLSATHPSLETFGENLSKITDDIFGARDTPQYFRKKIEDQIKIGYSIDDIRKSIQSDGVPLSLNLSILLQNMEKKNND